MEHKREADIEDYWLIQYQRLLESKPTSLLEKVYICTSVITVLKYVYVPWVCSSRLSIHVGSISAILLGPAFLRKKSLWGTNAGSFPKKAAGNRAYFEQKRFLREGS